MLILDLLIGIFQFFRINRNIYWIGFQLLCLESVCITSCPVGHEDSRSNKISSKPPFKSGHGQSLPWVRQPDQVRPPWTGQPSMTQSPLKPQIPLPGPNKPSVRPVFTPSPQPPPPPKTTTPPPLRYVGISYHPEPHYTVISGAIKICNFDGEVLCCHSSNFTKTEMGDCDHYHVPYPTVPYSIFIILDFKDYPVVEKWELDTFSLITNDQRNGLKLVCSKFALLKGKKNNISEHCSWQ